MELYQFKIGASPYFIAMNLNEVLGFSETTDVDGGYSVKGTVSIQSNKYSVNDAEVWFTTGQVYELYIQLQKAFETLKGEITFSNRDKSIFFHLVFNPLGQINVSGYFQEFPSEGNRLEFEFMLDQSHLPKTLNELKKIVHYYGDMKGI